MAFDFPNSPSVGQRVTGVGGIVYVWDGVKWASNIGSVTVQSMGDVGRNLLHNPLFNVAQRGAGPWTVSGYAADRWSAAIVTDTASFSISTLTDADRAGIGDEEANFALQNVFTGNAAAGAFHQLVQKIENVRRLGGKTITISFWAKAAAGTPKIGINFVQYFGSGGSPSTAVRVLATGNTVTLSTAWARYSSTIATPSISGKTLGTAGDHSSWLELWYSSGATNNAIAGSVGVQSGTIAIWGVQLEVGSVATPLEKPDPRYDLANCQRCYETGAFQLYGTVGVGNAVGFTQALSVTKRAAPTITVSGVSTVNLSGMSYAAAANSGLVVYAVGVAAGGFTHTGNYQASADF